MRQSALRMAALLAYGAACAVAGCSASQQAAYTKTVTAGQLFCAKATADGPIVVALANAVGVPVTVTNQTSSYVAAACSVINAFPVSPPANPGAAPVVAANVPTS